MSEREDFDRKELFHGDSETYDINDLHAYGMDILRKTGVLDKGRPKIGENFISDWGGDDDARFRCRMFAKSFEEGAVIYIYAHDKHLGDDAKPSIYSINTPIGKDGQPRPAYIQVLGGDFQTRSYYEGDSDAVKTVIGDMLEESNIDGPVLTEAGRDAFWESVASMALDDEVSSAMVNEYAVEVSKVCPEGDSSKIRSRIAKTALMQTVELDSGEMLATYAAVPERFMMRQIDQRLKRAGDIV